MKHPQKRYQRDPTSQKDSRNLHGTRPGKGVFICSMAGQAPYDILGDHTKANRPMAFAWSNLQSLSDWILWNDFFAEIPS